ncbi:uncharacterized protein K452DRAFT_74747 [Aplosporella prunicola CBS 121167]|uniref:Uncharacterized protein n=1 Tax=Aplosporella prunicola CBS 121167 TaxID=1176127 RepID=A0A6A6B6L3_9PEZI|nr:uncharacterized protein K452DRAFT_74747 [Aplosporella prunicola CBS 121167]KAF2139288.1 hypothetical protein K452DRAFT_74747 [Aplosporella prunicola CBS 121167]
MRTVNPGEKLRYLPGLPDVVGRRSCAFRVLAMPARLSTTKPRDVFLPNAQLTAQGRSNGTLPSAPRQTATTPSAHGHSRLQRCFSLCAGSAEAPPPLANPHQPKKQPARKTRYLGNDSPQTRRILSRTRTPLRERPPRTLLARKLPSGVAAHPSLGSFPGQRYRAKM